MRHTYQIAFALIFVVCLLASLVLGNSRRTSPVPPVSQSPSTTEPASHRLSDTPGSLESEVAGLLEERERLDETVWAKEVAAQRHEATIVKYWDRMLRPGDDKYAVLAEIPFETITLEESPETEELDWDIRLTTFTGRGKTLGRDEWVALLKNMKERGYHIDAIEFHQSEFDIDQDSKATSVFDVLLNVENVEELRRWTLQTKLRIAWTTDTDEDGDFLPGAVTVFDTRILEREGPPAFEQRILQPRLLPLSYLMAYDLNLDGLSDIVLPADNIVMWNRGSGEFESQELFTAPGIQAPTRFRTGIIADFNGDGHADLLCRVAYEPSRLSIAMDPKMGMFLFHGDGTGAFTTPGMLAVDRSHSMKTPSCLTAGDVDGDGDLDVWVGQYKNPYSRGQMPTPFYDANDGYPAYLLLNRGDGSFEDGTEEAGLGAKRFRRSYAGSLVDLDGDHDLDLLVTSDFAGSDVYLNDGSGHFVDVTSTILDESANFGMGHTFADYNQDGSLDFYVIGMGSTTMRRLNRMDTFRPDRPEYLEMRTRMGYGNRMYLASGAASYRQPDFKDSVARSGWSWGTSSLDFDSDGDMDIYVANGHRSGASTKDYCTQFWCHDIYTGNSEPNQAVNGLFAQTLLSQGESWDGYQKNHLFMNQSGENFMNVAFLMNAALGEDSRSVLSDDFDADGRPDILVTTTHRDKLRNQQYLTLRVLFNRWPDTQNWIGVRLYGSPNGASPNGAVIRIKTDSGEKLAHIVTGDSFRAQHAPMKHFGLGSNTSVKAIEIEWPDGTTEIMQSPAINQYHSVRSASLGSGN